MQILNIDTFAKRKKKVTYKIIITNKNHKKHYLIFRQESEANLDMAVLAAYFI